MDRREFLGAGAGALVLVSNPARADETLLNGTPLNRTPMARRYEITTELDVSAHSGPAQTWVPLIQTSRPYQRASAPRITCTGTAEQVADVRYGAPIVRAGWAGDGPKRLTVVQSIATVDRVLVPGRLDEAERRFWLQPTASVPTDGIVHERAMEIVAGRTEPKAKVRAIYDWVVDNTFRDPQTRGCGLGDIKTLLESNRLGGKCADLNSLMTGLCRAAGVPARDVYGIRFAPSVHQPSLGTKLQAGGDISHAQHCRSEVWLEGEGWFPVDPADVRKVVLEAKLAVDSPEVAAERERLFGRWEMNWVGYNSATDLALPGAPRPMEAHFLMYPYGMTPKADLDWLEPTAFDYKITSRQLV